MSRSDPFQIKGPGEPREADPLLAIQHLKSELAAQKQKTEAANKSRDQLKRRLDANCDASTLHNEERKKHLKRDQDDIKRLEKELAALRQETEAFKNTHDEIKLSHTKELQILNGKLQQQLQAHMGKLAEATKMHEQEKASLEKELAVEQIKANVALESAELYLNKFNLCKETREVERHEWEKEMAAL